MNWNAVIVLVSLLVVGYASSRSGRPEKLSDGSLRLRYTKVVPIMGAVCLMIPCFIAWYLLVVSTEGLAPALGLAAAFGLAGVSLMIAYRVSYVKVDAKGVERRSGFGRTTRIEWDEINSVDFEAKSTAFALRSSDGKLVWVTPILTGMKEFISALKDRTDPRIHEEACKNYAKWRRLPL